MTIENKDLLKTEFCGIDFSTPLVLLSGCVGFGEEYTRVEGYSNEEVGAVCLKGTTVEPRLGNKPHRVIETPMGMINAIGLQNPGAEHVIKKILPILPKDETRFIANLSGSTIEDYAEIARMFDDTDIDAVEINISCPNVKCGGMAFGNDPEMSAKVVEVCRKATSKPIITKLSPNQTDIAENPAVLREDNVTVAHYAEKIQTPDTANSSKTIENRPQPLYNNSLPGAQLGLYLKPQRVRTQITKLQQQYPQAFSQLDFVMTERQNKGVTMYGLRVGPFQNYTEANLFCSLAQSLGQKCLSAPFVGQPL